MEHDRETSGGLELEEVPEIRCKSLRMTLPMRFSGGRVRSVAEATARFQADFLRGVVEIIHRFSSLSQWRPVAYIENVSSDETQMNTRGQQQSDRQIAPVFVVEQSWTKGRCHQAKV